MIRSFDGRSDGIGFYAGTLGTTARTIAVLARPALLRDASLVEELDGAAFLQQGYGLRIGEGGSLAVRSYGTATTTDAVPEMVTAGRWQLLAASCGGSSATPRCHSYDFTTGVWRHADLGRPVTLSMGPAGLFILGKAGGLSPYKGELAAYAVWDQRLDDATVEQLASARNLTAWLRIGTPKALYPFRQLTPDDWEVDWASGAEVFGVNGVTSVLFESPPISYADATVFRLDESGWRERPLSQRTAAATWVRPSAIKVLR